MQGEPRRGQPATQSFLEPGLQGWSSGLTKSNPVHEDRTRGLAVNLSRQCECQGLPYIQAPERGSWGYWWNAPASLLVVLGSRSARPSWGQASGWGLSEPTWQE